MSGAGRRGRARLVLGAMLGASALCASRAGAQADVRSGWAGGFGGGPTTAPVGTRTVAFTPLVAPGAPPRQHHALTIAPDADPFPAAPLDSSPDRALATRQYYARFALGFAASILFHESAHFAASYLVGAHPTVGFDAGRPTVYSGIDAELEPHKQLVFSSAGLVAQAALDEVILDLPHRGGGAGALERGVLLGGLTTAYFYITLGRNGSVSDITYIARTSGWSKTDVSLVVGGVAALHTLRIGRNGRYARFFLAPGPDGRLAVTGRIAPDR